MNKDNIVNLKPSISFICLPGEMCVVKAHRTMANVYSVLARGSGVKEYQCTWWYNDQRFDMWLTENEIEAIKN